MAGGRFFGLASHRIRPQNGWQISSRKHAAGNRLPAIWSAIGTGSLVSSSSEDFDQWVFAIDRRRHVPHGKTDLLSDSSVRSDGNPLTSCCVRRAASPSHTAVVHEILQRGPYASILGEGYAGLARRRADRAHSLPPSSRRAAPPIYPDLIYDRHSRYRAPVQIGQSPRRHRGYAVTSRSPSPLPQTGIRLSRSWRGFLLLATALKQVVKHRKDLAAVADLADRQRRSIGAQTLIQRAKR